MTSVFISYRRHTAAGHARAIFNHLTSTLGESAVFMDVDSLSMGRDFRVELMKTLEVCDLVLVVIDKHWTTAKGENGHTRLEDPRDFVRMEVEAALKRNILVTPVLVDGARMPTVEELPREIGDLAYRNGVELTHARWSSDISEMCRRLKLDGPGPATESAKHPNLMTSLAPIISGRFRVRFIVIATAIVAAFSALFLFDFRFGEPLSVSSMTVTPGTPVAGENVNVSARVAGGTSPYSCDHSYGTSRGLQMLGCNVSENGKLSALVSVEKSVAPGPVSLVVAVTDGRQGRATSAAELRVISDATSNQRAILIGQLDSPNPNEREAAYEKLVRDYSADSRTIDGVLAMLELPYLARLSPEGRWKAFQFLNKTERSAWDVFRTWKAQAAIDRIRAREKTDKVAIGQSTADEMVKLEEYLKAIKAQMPQTVR